MVHAHALWIHAVLPADASFQFKVILNMLVIVNLYKIENVYVKKNNQYREEKFWTSS